MKYKLKQNVLKNNIKNTKLKQNNDRKHLYLQ